MNPNSIRFKISLLYTLIVGLVLVIYSAILYLSLSFVVYHDIDLRLREKVQEIQNSINAYRETFASDEYAIAEAINRTLHLEKVKKQELLQWPTVNKLDRAWKYKSQNLGLQYDYIIFFSSEGEIINSSQNIREDLLLTFKEYFSRINHEALSINNFISETSNFRIIVRPIVTGGRVSYNILLATSLDPILFVLESRLKLILGAIPLILLLTSIVGIVFSTRLLRPMRKIVDVLKSFSRKNTYSRIELKFKDEELQSLVDSFNQMLSRLDKSFHYIEKFSSDVAHELKTPLAIIRGESEVALKRQRDPKELKRVITICLEEAQRMDRIINDLLLLTRLDYQPQTIKFEKFDFKEFISRLFEQSKNLASLKKLKLELSLPKEDIKIEADATHLRRMFANLLDNAIKFTPENGLIKIAVSLLKNKISVEVSDNGIGIPEEDLPKIFDRFYHINRLSRSSENSAGLGLSIAKSIADMHMVNIRVSSALGKGTTFHLSFPLAN